MPFNRNSVCGQFINPKRCQATALQKESKAVSSHRTSKKPKRCRTALQERIVKKPEPLYSEHKNGAILDSVSRSGGCLIMDVDLSQHGLINPARVYGNLTASELVEMAVRRDEGLLAAK